MRILLVAAAVLLLSLSGCAEDEPDDGMDHGDGMSMSGSMSGTSTGSSTTPPPSSPQTHESVMRNNRFEPADITVRVGDTVHWTTEDPQAHNVVSTTPGSEFRSADISTIPVAYEQEFSHTFTKEGSVDYLCEYHSGMVGTITVTA